LDLATVLLFFPLLGGARQSLGLSQIVQEYGDRRAAQTAAALLRAMPTFSPADQPTAGFLLGNDFAELGLHELARRQFLALLDSPNLGGAAFVAMARLYDDTQDGGEALRAQAKHARWESMRDEDLAEAAYRVARACMRAGRHSEARDWLARISEDSPYFPPSRVLLLQTEYALGRTGAALDAADAVFRMRARTMTERWLQDRTAILTGDMLTEIGLYPYAAGVLEWPSVTSPFHARAERDRLVAHALLTGAPETTTELAAAEQSRRRSESEIERAVSSGEDRAARARELERVWPSARLSRERRRWAAGIAGAACDQVRGFDWRRPLEIVWRSLPPVVVYEMLRRKPTRAVSLDARPVTSEARFFFTPRPEIARLLVAVALASEPAPGDDCATRSANALALRAAGSLGAAESPATLDELRGIAAQCERTDSRALRVLLEAKLQDAIAAEASRRVLEIREQRYVLSEAIAATEIERQSLLRAAAGQDR
jgi:tetratricopeptide (TPR) repeat protein